MDEQRGQGRPFSECLKAPEAVRVWRSAWAPPPLTRAALTHHQDITAECARMRQLYFECKRTQLDMRKRFRGSPGY